MKLPSGKSFEFWDDGTRYTKVYHVACEHPEASDDNPGTAPGPFATISRAAEALQPGEKVIVHDGVYRECVRPARGGEGPEAMIAYEAAPGAQVTVKGSEVWSPQFRPSEGWKLDALGEGAAVWMADLPAHWFVGYNPFAVTNVPAEFWTFTRDWTEAEAHRFLLKRGRIFLEGRPLRQVFRVGDLAQADGAFWVEDPGLRIHLRLWEDADPNAMRFEVTAREQLFAPTQHHLGYIRVSGFRFEHAADGVPVPQRAAVSTTRGRHWIIEDNAIRWANGCGLDVGAQDWKSDDQARSGHHIIRRNTVSDCGACGIAGGTGADHTLVEDNVIERIGALNVERIWECAGLKFHVCTGSLFRRNVFRRIQHACGLWLDVANRDCRISGNVFADIESFQGGVYIECTHDPVLIDGNVFWDIRRSPWPPTGAGAGGIGVKVDAGENIVIAHNLFAKIGDYAVSVNLDQAERIINGRVGLCRRNHVLNNVFADCPRRILLGRAADNISNGNLFDLRDDRREQASLCIRCPEPQALVNLAAWQEYYGLDAHGAQAQVEADFDPDSLELTWRIAGDLPYRQRVPAMSEVTTVLPPGPFDPREWDKRPGSGCQRFPVDPSRALDADGRESAHRQRMRACIPRLWKAPHPL